MVTFGFVDHGVVVDCVARVGKLALVVALQSAGHLGRNLERPSSCVVIGLDGAAVHHY